MTALHHSGCNTHFSLSQVRAFRVNHSRRFKPRPENGTPDSTLELDSLFTGGKGRLTARHSLPKKEANFENLAVITTPHDDPSGCHFPPGAREQ